MFNFSHSFSYGHRNATRGSLRVALSGLFCVALLAAGEVQAQETISSKALEKLNLNLPSFNRGGDVHVVADKMTADHETGLAHLNGNVLLTFSDITLTCEKATYDYNTGDIRAEGNVDIYSQSGGSWHGEEIEFNHKTGRGLIGTGLLRLGTFSILADSIGRDEDGVAYSRNTTITTCTNEAHAWHWSVTGEGRYKPEEFIEMRNAVFRLCNIPVLWAPYYYRDFNTHYGVRFMPGYTSKWGAYLLTGYVYPIAGSSEDDAYLYGKTVVDLRSKYGFAAGQEFTWRTLSDFLGEDTVQSGRFSVYVSQADSGDVKERDANWQTPYNDYRYSIALRERLDFTPRDFLSVTGEFVSDSQFRTDFKEVSVRAISQPLGIANYEHRENDWVTSLSVGGPLNRFYAGVRKVPEFRLDTLPKKVFDVPNLYYESQTTAGFYARQPAKNKGALWNPDYDPPDRYRYSIGNWAYYEAFRLDTRHMFRRPFTLTDGVTFTPRLGWRGTYYSDSPDGDALFRSLFELGFTLKANYWKDFDNYRHTVMPYLDFTCVPASNGGAMDQPYAFDHLDQEYEWHDRYAANGLTPAHRYTGLRLGVRNLLQKRSQEEEDVSRRVLDLDLYSVFVLQHQDRWQRWTGREQPGRNDLSKPATRMKESSGMRVLGLDVVYSPKDNLDIVTDIQFDPEESELAFWDVGFRSYMRNFTFYGGYLRRNHMVYDYYWAEKLDDALIYGGFVHHVCDTFDWSLYARYNTKAQDLEEIGGYLQYNLDCMSFRFNIEHVSEYTTDDGYTHDKDLRLSLGAWLRAFPKDDDEEWMTWGNLANMQMLEHPKK